MFWTEPREKIILYSGNCVMFIGFVYRGKTMHQIFMFQEQISQPLCVHTWTFFVIFGPIYLMWMLTIVAPQYVLEKIYLTLVILVVVNYLYFKIRGDK